MSTSPTSNTTGESIPASAVRVEAGSDGAMRAEFPGGIVVDLASGNGIVGLSRGIPAAVSEWRDGRPVIGRSPVDLNPLKRRCRLGEPRSS
jgi:hypothetical protein